MVKVIVGLLIVVLGTGGLLWLCLHPKFGPFPHTLRSPRVLASPNYHQGAFQNQIPTRLFAEGTTFWSVLWGGLTGPKAVGLRPAGAVPAIRDNLLLWNRDDDGVVWLGHSSFFVQLAGKRLLIDPVFSPYAAPVSMAAQAFDGTTPYQAADMPAIDVLLITHSHWDHLDYDSVVALAPKVGRVIAPLGVGAYFRQWGYPEAKITEVDWNDQIEISDQLKVHALPARHYTRRLFDTNQTLWASFALVSPRRRLFFSGDSGYGPHFAAIGRQFGGFDLVALDSGQYDVRWPDIHMTPEQAARAATELGAQALLPAHIGRFALSRHGWNEPFDRSLSASAGRGYRLVTPLIGQVLSLNQQAADTPRWWREHSGTGHAPMKKMMLTVNGQSLPVTLVDSPAARELLALSPLNLTLKDYGAIEKIADLPGALSTTGAPRGMKPVAGDVAYYAPWGNLAIFLEEFSYADGLILLGRLDGGIDSLRVKGALPAILQSGEGVHQE